MTSFLVEGRRFHKSIHAVTFARQLAKLGNRAVEVHTETAVSVTKANRKWMATMHPPGTKRVLYPDRYIVKKTALASL